MLAGILDAIMGWRFRKLIIVDDSYHNFHLRYLIEIIISFMLGILMCFFKFMNSLFYTNILFFNLFDFFVYGIGGFFIAFLFRWKVDLLTLIFIIPSIILVGLMLAKVYIMGESSYPSYEWIASLIIIPLVSLLGVSLGKRFSIKKLSCK
jgi:hypothetical protein